MTAAGFPHSDISGSSLACQLTEAYRRLLRPSSSLDAKASTVCPCSITYQERSSSHTLCVTDNVYHRLIRNIKEPNKQ